MSATLCVDEVAKKPDKARDRIDLRVEPELRERVEGQADRFGQGLSAYIRQAIIERLERDESTDPNRED